MTTTEHIDADNISITPAFETPEKFQYDKKTMLQIYADNPLTKVRPKYLSSEFDQIVENGASTKLWKPDLWIQKLWDNEKEELENGGGVSSTSSTYTSSSKSHRYSNQRSCNTVADNLANSINNNKRLDRLKVESQDDIVLSPQRRSFGGGCLAPADAVGVKPPMTAPSNAGPPQIAATRRSNSPTAPPQRYRPAAGVTATRGRPPPSMNASQGGYASRSDNWRERNMRNGFQNEYDNRNQPQRRWMHAGGGNDRTSSSTSSNTNSGYCNPAPAHQHNYHQSYSHSNNRRFNDYGDFSATNNWSERDLPEWATDGPLDVHDTIDLHGFDDDVTNSSDVTGVANAKTKHNVAPESLSNTKNVDKDDILVNGTLPCQKLLNEAPSGGSRFTKFFTGKNNTENQQQSQPSINPVIAKNDLEAKTLIFGRNSLCGAAVTEKRISTDLLMQSGVEKCFNVDKLENAQDNRRNELSPGLKMHVGAMNLEELEAMLCKRPAPAPEVQIPQKLTNGFGYMANLQPKDTTVSEKMGKQMLLQDMFKTAEFAGCSKDENLIENVANMKMASFCAEVSRNNNNSNSTKPVTKGGRSLADPDQQQHLIDVLSKLQAQQRQAHVEGRDTDLRDASGQPRQPMPQQHNVAGAFPLMPPPMLNAVGLNALFAQQALLQNPNLMLNAATLQPNPIAPTPQDLLRNAHFAYQNALLNRKLEDNLVAKKQHDFVITTTNEADGFVSSASSKPVSSLTDFTPTSVLKQLHGANISAPKIITENYNLCNSKDDISPSSQQQVGVANAGGRPIVRQQQSSPRQTSAADTIGQAPPPTVAPPVELLRLVQHQQQRQQVLRLQQNMQMMQQMGGGVGIVPRLPVAGAMPKMGDADYQQMMAMAILQQQQQYRAAAGMDLIRQRALLAAMQQSQQQQAALNMLQQQRFRQPFVPSVSVHQAAQQQHELNIRLRNLFNVDGGGSNNTLPSSLNNQNSLGGAVPAQSMITLDELERMQKAALTSTTSAAS